ncbi:MAG: hypothetical protein Q4F79_05245 [Eubacteriales bacterium]|nr:hypothetical protein [Eubacteriales bacterium]
MAKRTRKSQKRQNRAKASAPKVDYHAKDRWFTVAKVLLAVSPLIALAYLQTASITVNGDLQGVLRQNPEMTVSFLASMTGPFAAYLLGFVQKHLHAGDGSYAMTNLTLIMIAEAMLKNAFYFIVIVVLMFFTLRMTDVNPIQGFRRKLHDHFLRDISGSLVLIAFSAFCLFASVQIGING